MIGGVRALLMLTLAGCGRIGFGTTNDPADGPANSDAIGPLGDAPASAITVTFGERSDAMFTGVSKDTHLAQAQPTLNFGGAIELDLDGPPTADNLLILFDTTAIPVNATVFSASLDLMITDTASAEARLQAFRMLRDWNEGSSNGVGGAASWQQPTLAELWEEAGAGGSERDTTVVADVMGPFILNTPITIALLPDAVQRWVADKTTNFGLVVTQINGTDGTGFGSREEPRESFRPLLTVTYVP